MELYINYRNAVNDRNLRRERVFRDRGNPYDEFSDKGFQLRYRLMKNTAIAVTDLIREELEPITERNHSISANVQLLLALRYFAKSPFQLEAGDLLGVSQPSVSVIVKRVSTALANLRPQFIKLPDTREATQKVKMDFYALARFPGVIGAIDCSHVKIKKPTALNSELYYSVRKQSYTINVQAVVDSKLRFLNFVCRSPGSYHDSRIFNESSLKLQLEDYPRGEHVLGDGGYACTTKVLTPILTPVTNAEKAYNYSHIRTRNTVERSFGVWKKRFTCLTRKLLTKLDTTMAILVATAVLHNIATDSNDPELNDVHLDDDDDDEPYDGRHTGIHYRNSIIAQHFNNVL